SERSNNIPPLAIKEEIFDEDISDRSISYHIIQLTAPINSQRESAQREFKTYSFCNKPDPLFKLDEANLELVVRLSCLHSFHLRCIIISLKKYTTCPCCQQPIYLGEDNDARLNPQEEEDRVKKFFKELSNRSQDYNLLLVTNVKTENLTTSDMQYEILDSHYPLGEALEKKLAKFISIHPLQTARILLNAEIKQQFSSNMSHNIFNKKKRSAKNIYNIFKTEGLGRVEIKRIKRISPSSFRKFIDKEIKIIQERGAVLMEFTRSLPEINRLFDAFSRSNAFRMKEHNTLLDTLADPVKGWDLDNY
ncbi:8247_t:CDS:2, partial [Funneliformis caledonium]